MINFRKYSCFLEHNLRKSVVRSRPYIYSIDPTNICNLRCIMCPQSLNDKSVARGIMTLEDFKKIFDKIKKYASIVILDLGGEPLLNKDLFAMISYINEKKPRTHVFLGTNATLMNKEKVEMMLRLKIDEIVFSFDGQTKKDYESIRRGAKFDITLKNINYFLKRKKELGKHSKIVIQTIRLYRPGAKPLISQSFKNNFKNIDSDVEFSHVFAHSWSSNFKKNKPIQYIDAPHSDKYFPCGVLWKQLAISWDGNVYACCFDLQREYFIGNLLKQSLDEVWNGKKMVNLRKSLIERKPSKLCKECPCIWELETSKLQNLVESIIRKF